VKNVLLTLYPGLSPGNNSIQMRDKNPQVEKAQKNQQIMMLRQITYEYL